MGEDIYPLGEGELKEKNILTTGAEKARQLKEKRLLQECILNDIWQTGVSMPVKPLEHVNYVPSWQRKFCSMPNNLGLT